MAYDDYSGILSELLSPQQGILSNPRDAALMQLGLGLLAQSGPQPRKVGLGEAFGRAGMPAMDTYRQGELDRQRRLLQALEIKRREDVLAEQKRLHDAQIGSMQTRELMQINQMVTKQQEEARKAAALANLKGVLSRPTEEQELTRMGLKRLPDGRVEIVNQNAYDQARSEPFNTTVRTPESVQGAALDVDPTGGILGRISQFQRPTLAGPGTGIIPQGASSPTTIMPFAPRPEPRPQRPIVIQGPSGPEYADPADAIGKPPPPSPGQSRAGEAAEREEVTIASVKKRIASMSKILQGNAGVVGPLGTARRIGETVVGAIPGQEGIPTPAIDYQNELSLLIADVRKMVEKDPNLSNEERRNLKETLGGGTFQTPGSAMRALNNVVGYVEGKRLTGRTSPRPVPSVGTVVRGYRFLGGDPSSQSSWEKAE